MINFQTYVNDEINEGIKYKYVIRNKKRVRKAKTSRPGRYRIEYDSNGKPHEVRITAAEKRNRRKGQKKAKLKRKAKQKMIALKRKRSFIARKSLGLNYNKKVPDKNSYEIAGKKIVNKKKANAEGPMDKLIHPANESYLMESPHSFLFTFDDYDVCWDFFSEECPEAPDWLEQLVEIYRDHKLTSVVPNGNGLPDGTKITSITIPQNSLPEITNNLMSGVEFLNFAKHDIKECSPELLKEIEKYVPYKLLSAIMPNINTTKV